MSDQLEDIRAQVAALQEQFERTIRPLRELQQSLRPLHAEIAKAVAEIAPAQEAAATQLQQAAADLKPLLEGQKLVAGAALEGGELVAGYAKTAEDLRAIYQALGTQDPQWQEDLRKLRNAAVHDASGLQAIFQQARDTFLSRRSGAVTALAKQLGRLEPSKRKEAGALVNDLKIAVESQLQNARAELDFVDHLDTALADPVDVTLPGRRPARGRRHPLTAAREDLEDLFVAMGYEVYDGPEVDDDYHCFEALNMSPDHPARDMQDTFYLKDRPGLVLRTHTSPAQIRYMLSNPHPPYVRIICPGKVFRRDDDVTHSPMFHQVEGLVVGPGITVGDLKGTVEAFLHALFGPQYPVRFRPSYFPYTEPSVEVDLGCIVCGGKGCRVCKRTGWLEIMGSGMVHPAVFEAVNKRLGKVVYDPEKVTGFAFGLGIDRVAMMRHGIDDIRLFYANDLRMLEQFPS